MRDVPKPLVRVAVDGRRATMLGYTLRSLQEAGLVDVWLLIAGDDATRRDDVAIEAHGERVARNLGLSLRVSHEGPRRGTAGALALVLPKLRAQTVVITPVDTIFPYHCLRDYIAVHRDEHDGLTWLVTTTWDEHVQNPGRVLLDKSRRRVVAALEGTRIARNVSTQGLVAATSGGVMLADRLFLASYLDVFEHEWESASPSDVYRDLVPWLLERGVTVHAMDVMQPVIDLGSPERIAPFLTRRVSAADAEDPNRHSKP